MKDKVASRLRTIEVRHLIAPAISVNVVSLCACLYTPDAALSNRFRIKRPLFDNLAQMMLKDQPATVIWPGNKFYTRPESLSVERWKLYYKILEDLRIDYADLRANGQVVVIIDRPSILHWAAYKGYFYSETPISEALLRSTLDGFRPRRENAHSGYTVYKQLDGPWYLFYTLD